MESAQIVEDHRQEERERERDRRRGARLSGGCVARGVVQSRPGTAHRSAVLPYSAMREGKTSFGAPAVLSIYHIDTSTCSIYIIDRYNSGIPAALPPSGCRGMSTAYRH